jgi:hypothetical protein
MSEAKEDNGQASNKIFLGHRPPKLIRQLKGPADHGSGGRLPKVADNPQRH